MTHQSNHVMNYDIWYFFCVESYSQVIYTKLYSFTTPTITFALPANQSQTNTISQSKVSISIRKHVQHHVADIVR